MTRFNNKYPYTDFHELNADWLLDTVQDAAAEAKEAAETVETYNSRLTTVEDDITNNISPAISTLQTEVETPTTGLLDRVAAVEGDLTNTVSPAISTLQSEVETPTTGLLDRVTALENQPVPSANAVYYLEFDSSLVSIDPDNAYDSRIEYDWLKQFVPLNTSGEDTHVIKLYDSHTQKVYDLAGFHLQESVSPDGIFVFTNRVEHLTGGVIDYYVNSTVVVSQNGTNPTFTESNEAVLPEVSIADAGSFLAVDENGEWGLDTPSAGGGTAGTFTQGGNINFDFADYIDYDDHILINIRGTLTGNLNAGATIVTGGPAVNNSSNLVGVVAELNDYNPLCIAYSTTGSIVVRPTLSTGATIYISVIVVK